MSTESKLNQIIENQGYHKKKLEQIDYILRGNGDPSRGLVVRFDRIEQDYLESKATKKKTTAMIAVALLGFLGSLSLFFIRLKWGI